MSKLRRSGILLLGLATVMAGLPAWTVSQFTCGSRKDSETTECTGCCSRLASGQSCCDDESDRQSTLLCLCNLASDPTVPVDPQSEKRLVSVAVLPSLSSGCPISVHDLRGTQSLQKPAHSPPIYLLYCCWLD